MSMPDWGVGDYRPTALTLLPAAEELVTAAGVRSGERVLDVGTGTGNVALLAARSGATVTGVDPSATLIEISRQAAADAGLAIDFAVGDAANLPVADGSVDLALSNFALIFAPDPAAAVRELTRVIAPEGRLAFTAWLPGGAIDRLTATGMAAVAEALGAAAGGPPRGGFGWHDQAAVRELFATTGRTWELTATEHEIAFTAESPQAYIDNVQSCHPMAVFGMQVIERAGLDPQPVRDRMLQVLVEGNEDPSAFKATSRYLVYQAR